MFVGTIGAFLGPLAIGVGVDLTGSYTPGWLIATAASALAVPLVLLARPPAELMAEYRLRGRPVELAAVTAARGADLH
jgi:cyanate permease